MPSLNEERGEQKFTPKKSLGRVLAQRHTLEWMRKEQVLYANVKYPVSTVEQFGGELRQEDIDLAVQYLKRAQVQGIHTIQGRQQLAKALSTLYDFTQAAVYLHGPLPEPGHPSGEIHEWTTGPAVSGA